MIRDTSKYEPFKLQMGGGTPSLKKLILHYAGELIRKKKLA